VRKSITQLGTNFINEIIEFLSEGGGSVSFAELERGLTAKVQACVCDIMSQYVEEVNKQIVSDKTSRLRAGFCVERHDDERRLLTTFGELCFARTYFASKDGTYAYLADRAVGIESYTRLSEGVSVALAKVAGEVSYSKSSRYVTGGEVSRQTVMNKVRACQPVPQSAPQMKLKIPALHIDADEDHVTMVGGRNSIVPLISIYEGIDKRGKRGICRNIFHISEYGKSTEELWEQALTEVESKYDLDGTKIYLHGDGAAWIAQGLEWFPNSIFVLDKYHKNKEIPKMTAGLDKTVRKQYEIQIRSALRESDRRFFGELTDSLIAQLPERAEIILNSASYLHNHIAGISICATDPEANNGGCTESHVSHVLSARLSSRPMAWSKQTLTQLAPMLADGGDVELRDKPQPTQDRLLIKATKTATATFKKITFAPKPDAIGKVVPIHFGKVSPLYKALRGISSPPMS
jgi:hypothetical protein